jgi:hypothetical protein
MGTQILPAKVNLFFTYLFLDARTMELSTND